MTTEPEHSLEVERKYDVDEATPLPDLHRLPGVASVGEAEPRELDGRYFDTPDAALGRALVAVRRRTGGPDAGWHIKRSTPEGKVETRWPLGEGEEGAVPGAITDVLADIASPPFAVIARIRNDRTAYALHDARGGVLAEFVDDRVTATDARRDSTSAWREWELELGPAASADPADVAAFFAAADELVALAGGRVAASGSKLARALGA